MKKVITSLFVLSLLPSCGTLFGGKTQTIFLSPSSGSNIKVEVSDERGVNRGETIPSIIMVKRSNQNLIINVKETDCYKKAQSFHESNINMFSLLNIFGGWFSTSSTSTDLATGGLWSYDEHVLVPVSKKSDCKK